MHETKSDEGMNKLFLFHNNIIRIALLIQQYAQNIEFLNSYKMYNPYFLQNINNNVRMAKYLQFR